MAVKKRIPSLRQHKPSQRAVVTLGGVDHYLGPWPTGQKQPSEEARTAYDALILEWLSGKHQIVADKNQLTLAELLLAFLRHAEQHYRREDGTQTSEVTEYKMTLRPVNHLYGALPVGEFVPTKLKAVRELMVQGYRHPKYGKQRALCRGVVNKRVGRIVRVFKWGVSEELVSESVWRALTTVSGLQRGRTEARETEPVEPVDVAIVEKTLPKLLPPVRAIIELMLLTGMRSGEAATMRACDIDRSGEIWTYKPKVHKTQHKGKSRCVALGPKAQAIIRPWLKVTCEGCNNHDKPKMLEIESGLCAVCRDRRNRGTISLLKLPAIKDDGTYYLFSPSEALELKRREQRRNRKTRVQPSQQNRRAKKRKRKPGECYDARAIQHAVARACVLAKVPHWHPHMLRHAHASEVRKQFGLEAAQVALGHATASITQLYAQRDESLARAVAKKLG